MKNRLFALLLALSLALLPACAQNTDTQDPSDPQDPAGTQDPVGTPSGDHPAGLVYQSTMPLTYATCFSVDTFEGGYLVIHTDEDRSYLVVPEGADLPEAEGFTVLQQPLDNIYLVGTATMSLFDAVDGLFAIRLSGSRAESWTIESAATAMQRGDILYAGKYSAPDYELLMAEGCDLSIQSTMIYHKPEVLEKLEELGIPVLVDRSSYEQHPLGRTEWVKLYGALLGREEEAARHFEQQMAALAEVEEREPTGKTVAFFYVTEEGTVSVRSPYDYLSTMIGMAGGVYIPTALDDPTSTASSVTMSVEDFYAAAREVDILLYNATIDDPLESIDQLVEKHEIFASFPAVQEGNVWSTDKSLYQSTGALGDIVRDFAAMLEGDEAKCRYVSHLGGEAAS